MKTAKKKAKAVAEVEMIRRDNVRDFLIGKPHRFGGRDGWADRNTIAKAMGFSPANINHWLMEPGSDGFRAISENTARTLEERLQLKTGALDLPGMGGHSPQIRVSAIADKADTLVQRAQSRLGVKLRKQDYLRVAKFFYNELREGRKVT